jgi:aconitate hydratase
MLECSETISERILRKHIVEGDVETNEEIAISIDQTLTQDATGTLVYMLFEAIGTPKVKTKQSVSYVDHNMLQTDSITGDDHRYLQTTASKFGVTFSKAGNGICHSVHLERFARPEWTLLGSDSHTPTAGAVGSLAIGAGGLDVAAAMSGEPYYLRMPEIVGVKLLGEKPAWVSSKDIMLFVLRILGVKGGLGKILEYFGDGAERLSVPERATITNMGAETGATASIFPSDKETLEYLESYGRASDWLKLQPPTDDAYADIIEVEVPNLEPLIARPHSPSNVIEVSQIEGIEVNQVCIGSCTNSSYKDIMKVASILKGKHVHPDVSLVLSPGSRTVLRALAENGALSDLISAGARILECACGPCIGMGQAPPSAGVSLRTFNRNFEGRSGTQNAKVYLASPEVAAVTALEGVITDPRRLGTPPTILSAEKFIIDDGLLIEPSKEPERISVVRGPYIKPPAPFEPLRDSLEGEILIKLSDNITTDHIIPAGSKILPLRSNIPEISKYVFHAIDQQFAANAANKGGGFVVGGENYGQGSSREHAALCPRYLGVKSIIAKSFARIHLSNLINFGILPMEFSSKKDYETLDPGDTIRISSAKDVLLKGESRFFVEDVTKNSSFEATCNLTERDRRILLEGGLLNFLKRKLKRGT